MTGHWWGCGSTITCRVGGVKWIAGELLFNPFRLQTLDQKLNGKVDS